MVLVAIKKSATKRRTALLAAALASGMAPGTRSSASALSNPRQAIVPIKCTIIDELDKKTKIPKCKDLHHDKDGWLNGSLHWYSQGQLVFIEQGPFYTEKHDERGEVLVFVDGNDVAADFQQFYLNPGTSVFTLPDLT